MLILVALRKKGAGMLLVRAYVGQDVADDGPGARAISRLIAMLFEACKEIIPAGMHSEQGPLTPGSIEFLPRRTSYLWITVDVFIEVEAFYQEDRKNLDERAEAMKRAFNQLFPGLTFVVRPKLVEAGYASDSNDPEFDGDMSMAAAIERANTAINLHPLQPTGH